MNNNISKKKGIFASSWLGVAAVWLGGHFGPGFATGAFSTTYYVRHGAPGILTPLIAMLVTGGVMYFMTEYARSHDVRNYKPFAMSCYGEKGGRIMSVLYDVTFLLTLLCAGGLAVSGEFTILNAQLGLPIIAGAVLTVVISALLCLYGSKLLSISSKYMMYAIVGVVLLITVLSFACGDYDLAGAFANSAANAKAPGVLSAILDGILYGCFQSTIVFNVMSVADLLEDQTATKKAIAAGYIITVVLMISLVFLLFSYTNVVDIVGGTKNLPVLYVLQNLGFGWLTGVYVLLMTLAVLTSTAGLAHAACVRFDKLFSFIANVQLRRFVITALALGIAGSGAALGMGPLLRTGTSVVGYIGIPVLVIPAFTVVRAKLGKSAEPQPDGVRGAA